MCGIAGFLNLKGIRSNMSTVCNRMLSRIQHRGPDESGIYSDPYVALGSVRLSIVDLAGGQQPMSAANERYWIVYNGEIFNYPELKTHLKQLGHSFRTECDTEVLLHAWLQYGPDCLKRLNGQFAFAIWDRQNQELFLARDRVGIRPLFYTWHKENLIFASEIKSLLEFPGFTAVLDPKALAQIYTFWAALSPKSAFKGINEVPPGHYLHISSKGTKLHQWWQLNYPLDESDRFQGSFEEACDELRSILSDAVRLRLRADVPVAAYLSGGLDSSATTALIRDVAPDAFQTFSIGFEDDEFDESDYQKETSEYLNTRHQFFTCKKSDIGELFPRVIWHTETPILRTAPVPMCCLSEKVRGENIKVVITGEGADEMLAGYDIFKEAIIRDFWSREPKSKYRPLLLNKLYPYLQQFKGRNQAMLKLFYGYKLEETASPLYSHFLRWKNTSNLLNYCSDDFRDTINGFDALKDVNQLLHTDINKWDRLSQSQWLEISTFMSPYLLSSQGDRVAMANSVEGRYPFLDYRLMEFTASLPPDYKMHGLNEKYILKMMMKGKLPKSVLQRPKQAYRAPVSKSFLSDHSPAYVNDMLSQENIKNTGIFNPAQVARLLEKINQSQLVSEIDNMALAAILSTQLLHHQFVLKKGNFSKEPELLKCKTLINHTS
ncbi:MAG: asparagine synthase (glutamine-hydrolyzing) [Carboxylicivirga sp.]|nr:asparagine synthase (glutamine-hydrolyzing) [Carboxylicivirga sp.]